MATRRPLMAITAVQALCQRREDDAGPDEELADRNTRRRSGDGTGGYLLDFSLGLVLVRVISAV